MKHQPMKQGQTTTPGISVSLKIIVFSMETPCWSPFEGLRHDSLFQALGGRAKASERKNEGGLSRGSFFLSLAFARPQQPRAWNKLPT